MSVKSLPQWLAYLEQLHPSEIELGLQRIHLVAERLQVLQPAAKVITVTGTNGKGSTCAFLAQMLRRHGLRTGVYSSPHFLHYAERIQIDGKPVSDELICQAFTAIEQARQDVSLTYFEFGTLAALWIFCRAELDAVILEVGLGGRLDAVNLVEPDISVITTIALDHADWLGTSREQVAAEKAGIMRSGKPLVCGDKQPPENLLQLAQEGGAVLYQRGREFDLQVTDTDWAWQGQRAGQQLSLNSLALLDLPLDNAAVALQVMALLDLPWQPQLMSAALEATSLTGRMQVVEQVYQGKKCRLLLDVAHNPQAASFVASRLQQRLQHGRCLAVFGALSDKDVAGVIAAMGDTVASWAVASLPSARSCSSQELQQMLSAAKVEHKLCANIRQALELQMQQADEQDLILVFGSFFTVALALEYLGLSGC